MGVQKHKRSKSRTHKKRSAWSTLTVTKAMTCPNCQEPKMPHHVCPSCGFYKDREVGKRDSASTEVVAQAK